MRIQGCIRTLHLANKWSNVIKRAEVFLTMKMNSPYILSVRSQSAWLSLDETRKLLSKYNYTVEVLWHNVDGELMKWQSNHLQKSQYVVRPGLNTGYIEYETLKVCNLFELASLYPDVIELYSIDFFIPAGLISSFPSEVFV